MILPTCLALGSGSLGGPAMPVSSYPSAAASPYGAASYGQGSYGQGSMGPMARAASPGAPAAPGLHTAYAPPETETRRGILTVVACAGVVFLVRDVQKPRNPPGEDSSVHNPAWTALSVAYGVLCKMHSSHRLDIRSFRCCIARMKNGSARSVYAPSCRDFTWLILKIVSSASLRLKTENDDAL